MESPGIGAVGIDCLFYFRRAIHGNSYFSMNENQSKWKLSDKTVLCNMFGSLNPVLPIFPR
jgi:hypothetical protein